MSTSRHRRYAFVSHMALAVFTLLVAVGAIIVIAALGPIDAFPSRWMNVGVSVATLVAAAWLSGRGLRGIVRTGLRRLATKTKFTWDDRIVKGNLVPRVARALPWAVIYWGIGPALGISGGGTAEAPSEWILISFQVVRRLSLALVVVALVRAVPPLLSAVNAIYNDGYSGARNRPIKGYLQVISLIAHGAATLAVVAVLAGTNPGVIFGSLGALAAVLMLVFRDTILSLVASIQISSNDIVRMGDWVSMPQANADGDVIDVALHTVKVQNWDKTISTIPTSKFITESFKNWRGMSESGGRRIKRALHIDMNSVQFLETGQMERLTRHETIRDYMSEKRRELEEHNARKGAATDGTVPELRRLTNIGTFRAYVHRYLLDHPGTHKGMTLLVRQLPPGPKGVPLEIYCFSEDTAWASYEGLQGDIFDHLIAILPEFGLRLFQEPTGRDLAALRGGDGGPMAGSSASG